MPENQKAIIAEDPKKAAPFMIDDIKEYVALRLENVSFINANEDFLIAARS